MDAGGWTSLPAELLMEVFNRLPAHADPVHIRQVCSHWRASTPPLAACRPWIVTGREPWRAVGPIGDHSFWLPRGGEQIRLRAPAGLSHCCGTPRGWLALTDDLRSPTRFVLWEPLTKAEIFLPCLPAVAQVFLSGDPLTSPDWMAIAIQKMAQYEWQQLYFWRPGDAAWTTQLIVEPVRIASVAFHQGRLYFTEMEGTLCIYDLESSPPKLVRRIRAYSSLVTEVMNRFGRFPGHPSGWRVVACNGELLLVAVYQSPGMVVAEVYGPDWAAEPLKLREKVTDLGEYSLFLGRGDGFALSAKEFPAIRRNCIYYVEHETDERGRWAVVFDLGSNASEHISYPEEHMGNGRRGNRNWFAYSWFCPRRPFLKQ